MSGVISASRVLRGVLIMVVGAGGVFAGGGHPVVGVVMGGIAALVLALLDSLFMRVSYSFVEDMLAAQVELEKVDGVLNDRREWGSVTDRIQKVRTLSRLARDSREHTTAA